MTPETIQEYGYWAAFWAVIVWMLWYLLRNHTEQQKKLVDEMAKLRKELQIMTDRLSIAVGKTTLTPSQITTVMRNAIWRQSQPKLDYLKRLLVENSIQERKDRLKENIKTELIRYSNAYVEDLNQYNTKLWLAGDYVKKEFPMDDFVNKLYSIFFEEHPWPDKELIIFRKLTDIESLMRKYQNEFVDDFYEKIKE